MSTTGVLRVADDCEVLATLHGRAGSAARAHVPPSSTRSELPKPSAEALLSLPEGVPTDSDSDSGAVPLAGSEQMEALMSRLQPTTAVDSAAEQVRCAAAAKQLVERGAEIANDRSHIAHVQLLRKLAHTDAQQLRRMQAMDERLQQRIGEFEVDYAEPKGACTELIGGGPAASMRTSRCLWFLKRQVDASIQELARIADVVREALPLSTNVNEVNLDQNVPAVVEREAARDRLIFELRRYIAALESTMRLMDDSLAYDQGPELNLLGHVANAAATMHKSLNALPDANVVDVLSGSRTSSTQFWCAAAQAAQFGQQVRKVHHDSQQQQKWKKLQQLATGMKQQRQSLQKAFRSDHDCCLERRRKAEIQLGMVECSRQCFRELLGEAGHVRQLRTAYNATLPKKKLFRGKKWQFEKMDLEREFTDEFEAGDDPELRQLKVECDHLESEWQHTVDQLNVEQEEINRKSAVGAVVLIVSKTAGLSSDDHSLLTCAASLERCLDFPDVLSLAKGIKDGKNKLEEKMFTVDQKNAINVLNRHLLLHGVENIHGTRHFKSGECKPLERWSESKQTAQKDDWNADLSAFLRGCYLEHHERVILEILGDGPSIQRLDEVLAQIPMTRETMELVRRRLEHENGTKVLKTVPISAFLDPNHMVAMYQAHSQTNNEWRHRGLVPIESWQCLPDKMIACSSFWHQNLRQWAADKPLKVKVATIRSVSETVSFLHSKGVLHGNLKPENVLLDHAGPQAAAALCDCLFLKMDAAQERANGARGYMLGQDAIPSTVDEHNRDVFALGLILFEITRSARIPCTAAGFADYETIQSQLDPADDTNVLDTLIGKLVDPATSMSAKDLHRKLGDWNILCCEVCADEFAFDCNPDGTDKGVACDNDHFLCSTCLEQQINTKTELQPGTEDMYVNAEELLLNDGCIACVHASTFADRCTAPPYTDAQVTRRVSEACNQRYMNAKHWVVRYQEHLKMQTELAAKVKELEERLKKDAATLAPEVLAEQLRSAFPGRQLRMCGRCNLGPVDHMACNSLRTHHGDGGISNACAGCGWFAATIGEWPLWDGVLRESGANGS
jgi:hypothetical protein